jgi:predicted transcriptional regulator of viral defense system
MNQHETEKERVLKIVNSLDETSPIQARVIYVNEYGDIAMQQVRKLFTELADDGTIERIRKGVYRQPA